jgi:hypothetical protein
MASSSFMSPFIALSSSIAACFAFCFLAYFGFGTEPFGSASAKGLSGSILARYFVENVQSN